MTDDIVTRLRHIHMEQDDLSVIADAAADEIMRLRAVIDAIDALHTPYDGQNGTKWCHECIRDYWPCPTHLLIHPQEADRD